MLMVHECEMEVPYELVFEFGETKQSLSGIWKGVAVSIAILSKCIAGIEC